jgi:hypothetical protein
MFAPVKRRTPCVADSIIHGQIVSQDLRIGTIGGTERNSIGRSKNRAETSGGLKQKIGSTPDGPI